MGSSLEPAKLARIVVPMFADEPNVEHQLRNGAHSKLLAGVAAQDDCAAYELTGKQILVFGSDYVRGPKFSLYERSHLSNYDIGWYLAGANLSDIAAMGAQPIGLLSVIRYPKDLDDSEFTEILAGIRDCCASVGAANVGGDIGTAERIILSASAFGSTEPDGLLLRSGARPGQIVVVSGPTGIAGSAMQFFASDDRDPDSAPDIAPGLNRWRRVAPRTSHGRLFSRLSGVTACVDTSDGLAGALGALCAASNVGVDIYAESVPLDPVVLKASDELAATPLELAFGDSVDFELVATVDADTLDQLVREAQMLALPLFAIGEVTATGQASLVAHGQRAALPGAPWVNAT